MSPVDGRLAEARALMATAREAGLVLALLGGLGVRASCPSATRPPLARDCEDMDFATTSPGPAVEAFLAAQGWKPEAEFNLYNGESRLIFQSPGGTKADIFLSAFSMCHRLQFTGRLVGGETLPLADLLLTKLQVREANRKDLSDAAAILLDHEVGPEGPDRIGEERLAALLGTDWGFWRTVRESLCKIEAWAPESGLPEAESDRLRAAARSLVTFLDTLPKTLAWRARSLVGEKLRWYDTPEEAER